MRRQVLERCQEIDCKCQSGGKELNSDSDLANRALPRAMSERQPFASLPPGRCQPAAAVLVVEPPPHEHCLQGSPTRRVHDDREQHRRLTPASEKGDKRFVTSTHFSAVLLIRLPFSVLLIPLALLSLSDNLDQGLDLGRRSHNQLNLRGGRPPMNVTS